MSRDDVWGILGSLLLFGMAYLDAGWRWFWAAAGTGMLMWSIFTIWNADDDRTIRPGK